MINRENIEAVLKHNGINENNFSINHHGRNISIGSGTPRWCSVSFNNPNWLQIIEAHLGQKLEPLPESNPFDVVKVGQWIRYIGARRYTSKNKWYQRIEDEDNPHLFWYKRDDDLIFGTRHYQEWDLTDIRDYNQDEEIVLAVEDEVVTKGAFARVEGFDYDKQIIQLYVNKYGYNGVFLNQIELVNGRRGKFVIPKFNFEKTLLDAGFQIMEFISLGLISLVHKALFICKNNNKYYMRGTFKDIELKPTPQTAKILIDLKNNFEELEK